MGPELVVEARRGGFLAVLEAADHFVVDVHLVALLPRVRRRRIHRPAAAALIVVHLSLSIDSPSSIARGKTD